VLAAKLAISGAVGFVLGLLSAGIAILVAQPTFSGLGMGEQFLTAIGAQVALGGAVASALIAVIATAIGSLFRNTATAAGAVLGLILIAPGLAGLLPVVGSTVNQFLPSSAGMLLSQPADTTGWSTLLAGLLVLLGWAVASTGLATVLWKRRDV
jgi:ABC-2 type transport system permease protein